MLVNLLRSVSALAETPLRRCRTLTTMRFSATALIFWLHPYAGLEKLFHLKGAKHVAANQAEPGTEPHGRPRVDLRRSSGCCGRNDHRVPGHLASQEWPHSRRLVRSQLAGKGRTFRMK
jgi:hypothetical protein